MTVISGVVGRRALLLSTLGYCPLVLAQDGAGLLVWTLVKAILASVLLLGITFMALKMYVKWRGADIAMGHGLRDIRIQESLRVSQRLTLYSLSWGDKEYLVAEATDNLTLIDQRQKEKDVTA